MRFHFFSRVAVRLDKSDIVDWLTTEVKVNNVQLDTRVKKYAELIVLDRVKADRCLFTMTSFRQLKYCESHTSRLDIQLS